MKTGRFVFALLLALPFFTGAQDFDVFNNWSLEAVKNNPPNQTVFTIQESLYLIYIDSYHYNEGKGDEPGWIKLEDENGKEFGPWEAQAFEGVNGEPNIWWIAEPFVIIPPGTYTVIDSKPETWSHNSESGNAGFCFVRAEKPNGQIEYGAAVQSVQAESPKQIPGFFEGTYKTTFGQVTITIEDKQLKGVYKRKKNRMNGTFINGQFDGRWGGILLNGRMKFTFSEEGEKIKGYFGVADEEPNVAFWGNAIEIKQESDLSLLGGVGQTPGIVSQANTTSTNTEISGNENQEYEIPLGQNLYERTINTLHKAHTASVGQKIEVNVPLGVAEPGSKFTISKVDKKFHYEEFKILDNYQVTLAKKTQFEKPLVVKLFIDKDRTRSEINKTNFAPAYYDEELQNWVKYTDYTLDAAEASLTFKTNHLTILGVIEFASTGFYTHKFENNDCVVYYQANLGSSHEPLGNKDYNNYDTESWHITDEKDKNFTVPFYVQDIAHWMSEVKTTYCSAPYNLWVPEGKINVYVKNLGGADGEYGSVAGCIYFHNKMHSPVPGNSRAQHLKATVAHEFLHLIQDHYYVMNKAGIDLWWLEALATQADRMIFENDLVMSECEVWAQQDYATQRLADEGIPSRRLEHALAHSWDQCTQNIVLQKGNNLIFRQNSKAISIYGAGMFLQYLSYYREGEKLNVADLLKTGGTNTQIKYYRTILNNYLWSNLKTSIEEEYAKFVKWLYEPNPSQLNFQAGSAFDENHVPVKIHDKFSKTLLSEELPYLSAKIIKLRKDRTSKTFKLELKVESASKDLEIYLCERKNRMPSIKRQLKVSEMDSLTISKQIPYSDILIINKNRDKAGSVSISIKNKDKEALKKEEKIEPYPMGEEIDFFLRNAKYLVFKNWSRFDGDQKDSYGGGWNQWQAAYIKSSSNKQKKIMQQDNIGPDFSKTIQTSIDFKGHKKRYYNSLTKIEGTINADYTRIKTFSIESNSKSVYDFMYDWSEGKQLYETTNQSWKLVLEDVPVYSSNTLSETGEKIFIVKLKTKERIKECFKSFSFTNESNVDDAKGKMSTQRFSHFDWDNAPDQVDLEIKIIRGK